MTERSLKQTLYNLCQAFVEERMSLYSNAMKEAQEAANQEEKSSAGDKYETTRAMMQIEKDQHAKQLEETSKLKKTLSLINPNASSDTVGLGSLVCTDKGNFFISISAGKLPTEQGVYLALAPTSPLGAAFMQQKAPARVTFNGQVYQILKVS